MRSSMPPFAALLAVLLLAGLASAEDAPKPKPEARARPLA